MSIEAQLSSHGHLLTVGCGRVKPLVPGLFALSSRCSLVPTVHSLQSPDPSSVIVDHFASPLGDTSTPYQVRCRQVVEYRGKDL